ncbi:phosphoenolpyruvate--protein phosphotransferase [Phycisphaerales bacterium AB-hyl4]|uniref:Phosphoenolpyruvate-protein phosphotransferase n=1 Tax=Natronomicrosphaera hydrolytica TaxID=3242702 RepID=A0ABV4U0L8_9BACT
MQIKKGIPVSPGVAIYPALVLDAEDQPIPRRSVSASRVPHEHERLDQAIAASIDELEQLRQQTATALGEELAKIFDFHQGMLRDEYLIKQIRAIVDADRVTAEYAVYQATHRLAETFLQQERSYLRERVSDVYDLQKRILKHLVGYTRTELSQLTSPAVVVAHDLTPSQTAALDKTKIKGLATDAGGRTSHTAILAHALGIPAVVGLGSITRQIASGETVIIDGHQGQIIIDPDAAKLMEYRQELRRMAAMEDTLGELSKLPAVTKDGTKVNLLANIEFPSEIPPAIHNGAVGIGLYRTEFLFLAADNEPAEQEQYETYVEAIRNLDGLPLTVRTLDLGADKLTHQMTLAGGDTHERNPFLGCRSIRLCLQNLPLFKTQLRAILRASTQGPVKIMFPLISNIMELRQAKMILNDVMEDLDEQGIEYARDIPIGIMVEVPSAALQARAFTREVDFFSIGTNDLIQYTVAVDRGNERIASLYSAAHPAVISLIKEIIRAGQRAKIDVSLCGEMAGEPEFTMLLLGLGLRCFSITPPAIPEIKRILRSVNIEQCQKVARRVSAFDSDREVLNYLRDELGKVVPEAIGGRSARY